VSIYTAHSEKISNALSTSLQYFTLFTKTVTILFIVV